MSNTSCLIVKMCLYVQCTYTTDYLLNKTKTKICNINKEKLSWEQRN